MKITKKELEKSQVELLVELTEEEVKPHLEAAAKRMSEKISIPGFRPGHVPYNVMKKNAGEGSIYQEAFESMVEATYPSALEQEKLDTFGAPRVDVEKLAPGNPVIYKVIVNLLPKVTLGDYEALKASPNVAEAGEKEIKKTLEDLCNMRAKEKAVDRAAKKGDKVTADFDIYIDNVAIDGGSAKKQAIVIGDGHFIPGFEEGLIGMKKDEEKTVKVTFPKEYHQKSIAGKEADAKFKVYEVFERETPELNDDFAATVGPFKSLDELKEQLKKNMGQELQNKEDQKFELAAIEEVVEKSKIEEIPEELIVSEREKMLHELEGDLSKRGAKMEDYLQSIKKTKEELDDDFTPRAERRVKTALVAREISIQEKLGVTEAELDKEVEVSLGMYKDNPEAEKQFKTPQYRSYVRNFLMNRKVFELLHSRATKSSVKKEGKSEEKKKEVKK